jgi:hypothetical protein
MTIQNVLNCGSILKNAARLDRVNELAFIEYATNKAVEKVVIIQTEKGKFILVTKVTWKEPLSVIETARGDVKEWADLERLAAHIESKFPVLPCIELIFNTSFAKGLLGKVKNIKSVQFDTGP